MTDGISTLLVMVILPFSRGQERSTFPSCSQRSAVVDSSWIRPYLTTIFAYAPFLILCFTSPDAVMSSGLPLQHCQSVGAQKTEYRHSIRLGWVGRQVNFRNCQEVIVAVRTAVLQRRISGNLEAVIKGSSRAGPNAHGCCWSHKEGRQAADGGRKSHDDRVYRDGMGDMVVERSKFGRRVV